MGDQLILGIDAGGSKTIAWLARVTPDAQATVLGRGTAGPGNPLSAGPQTAHANIQKAYHEACTQAEIGARPIAAACLAVAGASRPEVGDPLQWWAEGERLAARIRIVPDAAPVLAAGTPQGWGIALISGTGSVAWGRASTGETASAGGWGFLIGDEGSGFAIGQAGLRAVTWAVDDRAAPTALVERILGQLNLPDALSLKETIYAADDPRRLVASLAPTVIAAAEEGDALAQSIVTDAAHGLVAQVLGVARRLKLSRGEFPLALAGSVVVHSALVRQQLETHLRAAGLEARPIHLVKNPVEGCLSLAQRDL